MELFKDELIIIPCKLRRKMLEYAHIANAGIGASQRWLRDTMFWPGMARDMESFVKDCAIKDCAICIRYWEQRNNIEPLIPHHIGYHPWSKIGIDLCEMDQRRLLHLLVYTS